MDRGELLDRQDRVWRLIDNLRHALRAKLSRPGRWNEEIYVDRDPRLDWTTDGVVHDDGSMTLSSGAYFTLEQAHDAMYQQQVAGDPPTDESTRQVRDAVGVFVRNYVDLYHEPVPDEPVAKALDTGLGANTTAAYLPQVMADIRLDTAYPGILDLADEEQHPRLRPPPRRCANRSAKPPGSPPTTCATGSKPHPRPNGGPNCPMR